MKNAISLLVFVVIVIGAGSAIGTLTAPGEWYAALNKPFFNPPNWVFAPVWTLLYLMIAVAGWRVWQQPGHPALFRLWLVQMGLNFLWSPLFFALQMPGVALVVIAALLATISLFIKTAWPLDRVSGLLFIPYAAWVGFASALNAAIFFLN
ncbi:TspO/MBR family protein [uncultured Aliiroseovarius sp.]|uniref:TspO/MBR family protein n=1 Tax=uncultured Aliiroseovarius sp. TaxID=1658783 RepID=UPI0025939F74|nr:TspO/MBR family protein [uncultured Aliiroseovarius sp.]